MEEVVLRILKDRGPLTGAELLEAVAGDGLALYLACKRSPVLTIRSLGRHYLRLDRKIDGEARLSPSLYREFLTYSIIGHRGDEAATERRLHTLAAHTEAVSTKKLDIIYDVVQAIARREAYAWPPESRVCFILAGDIVYGMAHDVPRRERSSRRRVNGSDMDLVVLADETLPEPLLTRLDTAIYDEKHRLLMTPHLREEIDYVVKRMSRVQEQSSFQSFRQRVACKILDEGTFLYGSEDLFCAMKALLREQGISTRLREMEKRARLLRREAEAWILHQERSKISSEDLSLFYPDDESEEFE